MTKKTIAARGAEMTDPTTAAVEAAFHRAMIEPEAWAVRCPACDHTQAVDVTQDNSGAWRGDGADQFPECEGCGALLEVVPVEVRPVASHETSSGDTQQPLPIAGDTQAIAARGAGGADGR